MKLLFRAMRQYKSGFSLVELIVILVILGIITTTVMSRFVTPNAFSELSVRDSLVVTIRQAQQLALGRNNITFEIDSVGNEWQFSARESGAVLRSTNVDANNNLLQTGSVISTADNCETGTSFNTALANDFSLSFDEIGNLSSFTNNGLTTLAGPTFNGVRICLNDTVRLSVCVSPAGYAHEGDCDA